jgi:hypothetical protein
MQGCFNYARAQGIVASSAMVGQVGTSVFGEGIPIPAGNSRTPSGCVYVVPFELPESAIVERELTAEQDCAICHECKK